MRDLKPEHRGKIGVPGVVGVFNPEYNEDSRRGGGVAMLILGGGERAAGSAGHSSSAQPFCRIRSLGWMGRAICALWRLCRDQP